MKNLEYTNIERNQVKVEQGLGEIGNGALLLNNDRVSVWDYEKNQKLDSGDGYTFVSVIKATELHT